MAEGARQFVDECLLLEDSKDVVIARIQLIRSVKSSVLASSSTNFDIILASEFFEAIPKLIESVSVFAVFIPQLIGPSTAIVKTLKESWVHPCELSRTQRGPCQFSLTFPADVGIYQLFLFSNQKSFCSGDTTENRKIIILPLLSSQFNVESADQMKIYSYVMPLLASFRIIDDVVIEEEYGKMLGSHIYDSSVAILRYLTLHLGRLFETGANTFPTSSSSDIDVALELGAGCGLVSIWLSKKQYFRRVIATDIELQLPLIDRNIKRNAAQESCVCKSLDWNNYLKDWKHDEGTQPTIRREKLENQLFHDIELIRETDAFDIEGPTYCQLQHEHLNIAKIERLKVIIAGDVLYSPELAGAFFSVVRAFAQPNFTTILVAQKLRNLNQVETVDVRSFHGFRSEIVWQEANVTIWKLLFIA